MKRLIKISIITVFFVELFFGYGVTYASVNYIVGSDRYETSTLIAENLNYDTAILVNDEDIAGGLSASGLSGAANAPIIFVQNDKIPKSVEAQLGEVKKVYIIGDTSVISKKIQDKLIKRGIKVKRLKGRDIYDTSIRVANEIGRLKGIQEIYYVNGSKPYADAVSVAAVASKNKNPILLTDGTKCNFFVKEAKAYVVGGHSVMSKTFDEFAERLAGKDRFETNKIVIDKFFASKKHIYLCNSEGFQDVLLASANKKPILLVDDYSDKTVLEGVRDITVVGEVNRRAIAQAKSYIYGEKVVFYVQHQDDETIFASSAIIDAINCRGKENVYVVLVTDGTASSSLRDERYRYLTEEEKSTIRDNEFKAACSRLGVDEKNIVLLNEKESEWNTDSLRKKILEFENKFKSVTHIGHSYKYDIQAQHLENGKVILQLYKEGTIKDCRFFARNPEMIKNMDLKYYIESIADGEEEKEKVINAAFEYNVDYGDFQREGIGFKSVPDLFNKLMYSSHMQSYLHEPEL